MWSPMKALSHCHKLRTKRKAIWQLLVDMQEPNLIQMINAKVKCVDSFRIEFLKSCILILMVNKVFLVAILASNISNSLDYFVSKGPKGMCGSLYCDYTLLSTQKMVWSQLCYSIKFKECKILLMFLCKHNYD